MFIKYSHIFIFYILLIIGSTQLLGQPYSLDNPYVTNYSKSDYNGGIENWDVICNKNGTVFFANNEGLLYFNGANWSMHHIPNKTIIRSIAIDSIENRIYVGGQDEIGYFSANNKGQLVYTSIKAFLPKEFKSIEDVWDLTIISGHVYFRSVYQIFDYYNQKIELINTTSTSIQFLSQMNGVVYYSDAKKGLFKIINDKEQFLSGSEILKNDRVTDFVQISKDSFLIITEKKGIFQFNGKTFTPFLKNNTLSANIMVSGVMVNKELIAIGTVLGGVIFFDNKGRQIFTLTKKHGLQNNSIICLGADSNGHIWTGTTNGIDHILINSPFSLLYPDGDQQGAAYAVKLYKDKLYVGTNNGLFYTEWPFPMKEYASYQFKKVENTSGQVWGLDIVNGELFMGHNNGAFQILGDEASKISSDGLGAWRFLKLDDPNQMIVGTYSGFHLYKKNNNNWVFSNVISGFKESARIVAYDKDNGLWVSHPYRGVFKLKMDKNLTTFTEVIHYDQSKGLPSNLGNYITNIDNDIYVTGEVGIYKYYKESDSFQVDDKMMEIIGNDINIRRLFQGVQDDDIWFITDTNCGVIKIDNDPLTKTITKIHTPFIYSKLIGGFENIYVYDQSQVFACTDKGLILINVEKLDKNNTTEIRFNSLLIKGTSKTDTIYDGHQMVQHKKLSFPHDQNNLFLNIGSNHFEITDPISYSFFLSGIDKTWSPWSSSNVKEFSNLPASSYSIMVKCKNNKGAESEIITYDFKILPTWYNSLLAKLIYLILFCILLFYALKKINRKHESEKSLLIIEKEESDAKVESLLNEKLQSEIHFKNKELALSTMHLVQKNEAINKLREELDNIIYQTKDIETKKQIKKVSSILSDDQRLEDDWDSFAVHFDQVHTDFLRRLKEEHPSLSPKDLKLCAYLRMNMTTKDIAPLLNISIRGVEISRYRLRKKLNLDAELNLNDFMMQY